MTTSTLKPGDPPPFWAGYWHPQGLAEGGVHVQPLGAGVLAAAPVAPPVAPPPAAPPVEAPPIATAPPAAPTPQAPAPAAEAPIVLAPPPVAPATAPAPAAPPALEAPPIAATPPAAAAPPIAAPPPAAEAPPPQPLPPVPPQAAPAQWPAGYAKGVSPQLPARSYVALLANQGPLTAAQPAQMPKDPARAQAAAAQAQAAMAQNQLGPAIQALAAALAASPAEPQLYAMMGQVLLAGQAWEDALHHHLLAYMLDPRQPAYGRSAMYAAFAQGYVGWTFLMAQAVHKLAPSEDLATIGRQAHGWLQSREPMITALDTKARSTALLPDHTPLPPTVPSGPCNALGVQGLQLLASGGPQPRLFVGAADAASGQPVVVVPCKGGPLGHTGQPIRIASL